MDENMHVEVSVALNFVISYLYSKLPRRRVDGLGEELEKGLKKKFEGHWYPDKPFKGSAFRCIRVSGEEMDPVMEWSANKAGLDISEIQEYLPKDLTIWIDPCEVSYKIGEKGAVKVLYSDKRPEMPEDTSAMDTEVQNVNRSFNPEAQSFRPIDSLSSSLTNLSMSPSPNGWSTNTSNSPPSVTPMAVSTSPVAAFHNRNTQTFMTAAAFAATKFGSTKLKSQAKRPSRLSPTEFQAFGKPRGGFQLSSPVGQHQMISTSPFYGGSNGVIGAPTLGSPLQPHSRSLSPRDHRGEYDQQMMFLLQQQQQHQQHKGFPQSPQHQSPHQQPSLLFPTSDMLAPAASALSELYHSAPQSTAVSPSADVNINLELLQSPLHKGSMPNLQQSSVSPTEPNKNFSDSLGWSNLPPYANLQHLLVAN